MDFTSIETSDPESSVTRQLLLSLRHSIWRHQQHLLANPDPTDEWWFLVDPSAAEPLASDWASRAD